jgi:hypothetical protein
VSTTVFEVNPNKASDISLVNALIARNFALNTSWNRTSWLYQNCTFGEAIAFVLMKDLEPIGIAAAFPRKFLKNNQEIHIWVLGDFAIDQPFRALGPAVQLQRALLQKLEEKSVSYYDLPSVQMQAVYTRLGVTPVLTLSRWTYPLALAVGTKEALRSASRAASRLALYPRRLVTGLSRGFKLTKATAAEIPAEELTRSAANHLGCLCHRTSEYLGWRYERNGGYKTDLFLLTDSYGTIRGYTACRALDRRMLVLDWIADEEAFPSLLAATCELASVAKFDAVDCVLPDRHRVQPLLKSAGFFKRESSALFTGGQCKDEPLFIMDGDRES